ncbi:MULTISPECIES: TRAP transporter small permease subunit [Neptunomonas]|uniref:TRAP transporter small permease protein n=1 Tax=Neptunomonas qingdaonensis TaxID=1045558 RepID=A0A1I2VTH0_9GAMM|nr:TRAP transporter small permease subunit [Neptunomonas qingdaonensis]SFG92528.1 TRAP-type mannitol/chloroaromatic compound transport system, small permease component [Neptunomonas qingdaonensis]
MTENDTLPSVPLADMIDRFIQRIGMSVAWCYVLLVFVIILQVVLRKGFSSGLIIFEELQWHLYALGVMIGLSYAQTTNSHIRVDLFYSRFRARTKHIIEILGILILVMPFIVIVFLHSIDFFYDAYRINEGSQSPSGLPYRWIIKGVIPVSFALLGLAMLSRLYRDTVLLMRGE